MLELIVAALIQVTILTSGSAPIKTTSTPTSTTTIQSAAAPSTSTGIGTSGWDDRN